VASISVRLVLCLNHNRHYHLHFYALFVIENGLNPFRYLKLLLETIPNCTTGQIALLLPWCPEVHARCKVGAV
jgi:hypothetical protein